jgi:methylmalonyl-CoA mutase cobalamin-binding subunit
MALASQVLAVLGPEPPPSCEPLAPHRDAARFEALRERAARLAARTGAPLRAWIVPVGAASAARARGGFSQRLLEVGGLSVTVARACTTADDAAVAAASREAADDGAPVVCLAGADDAYDAMALPLARAITSAAARPPVLLQAGRPASGRDAALREAGVSWFFAGGDAADVLEEVLARLEVRAVGEVER